MPLCPQPPGAAPCAGIKENLMERKLVKHYDNCGFCHVRLVLHIIKSH